MDYIIRHFTHNVYIFLSSFPLITNLLKTMQRNKSKNEILFLLDFFFYSQQTAILAYAFYYYRVINQTVCGIKIEISLTISYF